jgi:hypothetical protein
MTIPAPTIRFQFQEKNLNYFPCTGIKLNPCNPIDETELPSPFYFRLRLAYPKWDQRRYHSVFYNKVLFMSDVANVFFETSRMSATKASCFSSISVDNGIALLSIWILDLIATLECCSYYVLPATKAHKKNTSLSKRRLQGPPRRSVLCCSHLTNLKFWFHCFVYNMCFI